MKSRLVRVMCVAAMAAASLTAYAQNQYEGVDIYATGGNPPLDGFAPGTSASLQLLNDGTNGDASLGDSVWSRDVLLLAAPTAANGRFAWKMGAAGWSKESPSSGDVFARAVENQTLKFVFDTAPKNDGFAPDAGAGIYTRGLVWTVPGPMVSTVRVTGDFISELGGTDWDANSTYTLMNDSGLNGDASPGDGIFTFSVSGLPAGSYIYKYTTDGHFDFAVGAGGGWNRGGNISLTITNPSDVAKFEIDVARGGRIKFSSSVPTTYHALSNKWGTSLNSTTQLYDDGSNGDVTPSDGVFARKFNTNSDGNDTVWVESSSAGRYPGSGGYPIDIVTTGQAVLVQFDTNVRGDGYLPNTNYVWTDAGSRNLAATPVIVGNFTPQQFGYAIGGTYNNSSPEFRAYDDGSAATIPATSQTSGDPTAGDLVFMTKQQTFVNLSSVDWKGVANSGSWDTEFSAQGFTRGVDSPKAQVTANAGEHVIFAADGITGRIRSFVGNSGVTASNPQRPDSIHELAAPASVNDWAMY